MATTEWVYVDQAGALEGALADFHWTCAFVREASAVSPSQLRPDGSVVNPDAAVDLRLIVVAGCKQFGGLELHLHCAEDLHVPFLTDLAPSLEVRHDRVRLSLSARHPAMTGRALRWRVLTRAELFNDAVLGRSQPDDLDARLWDTRVVP